MTPQLQVAESLLVGASRAAERSLDYFLRAQYGPGYWMGELTADTTLESDYILLQLWLHPPVDGVWDPAARPLIDKALDLILQRQLPDGGVDLYSQGPADRGPVG